MKPYSRPSIYGQSTDHIRGREKECEGKRGGAYKIMDIITVGLYLVVIDILDIYKRNIWVGLGDLE